MDIYGIHVKFHVFSFCFPMLQCLDWKRFLLSGWSTYLHPYQTHLPVRVDSCFWWFAVGFVWQKTYVLYWNIKKHTFGKNHFCVGKIIIWACDWHLFICFVLFLFSFLFTQYIMNKMAAFTSTRQLRIESILQVQLHRWISNPWLSTRSLLLLGWSS